MRVGGSRRRLGVVLDAERGDVEEGYALGRAVVEVDVREADAPEARVVDDGGDAAAHPEAQVAVGGVLGDAVGELGDQRAEAGEQDPEAVVLGGDLHAAGEQVHHGVVAAAMAELELLDLGAGGLADHLMPQADAEHGQLAEQLLDLGVGAADGVGIARSVGQEHAVGLHGQHVLGGRVPRNDREVAAAADEVLKDRQLRAAVVGDDLVLGAFRRGDGVRRGQGRRVEGVHGIAGHGGGEVLAHDRRAGPHLREKAFDVGVDGGDHRALGAGVAHMAHEGARVDSLDGDDAVVLEEPGQRDVAAPVARLLAHVAHDEAAAGGLGALHVLEVDAVVADLRVCHRDDLPGIRGIGDDLEVPLQGGVEADLAERLALGRARGARKRRAVLQDEHRRTRLRFGRGLEELVA